MTSSQTIPTSGRKPIRDQTVSHSVSTHNIDEAFFTRISREFQSWQQLFDNDPVARIAQHPEFVLTELRHADEVHPRPPVFVRCDRGDKTVGAAILIPKSIGGEKRFGPAWNLKGYRLAGNRLLGEAAPEEKQTLLNEVASVLKSTRADFLLVEDLESTDPLTALIESTSLRVFRPNEPQRRLKIELPETHDDYWAAFKSKTRSTLRRKLRQFGECRLERISHPDQVAHFIEQAQRISRNTWQYELLGERIRNDDAELAQFTFLATEGALRSYLLWKDDEPLSFLYATQHNGVLNYEEVGYDRRFRKQAPGQMLMMKVLEELYEDDPPRVFDFGGGDAEYKRTFGNLETESGNIWLLRPGLRSRMIVAYLTGRRIFGRNLRCLLAKCGLLEWVRHRTRRGILSNE